MMSSYQLMCEIKFFKTRKKIIKIAARKNQTVSIEAN